MNDLELKALFVYLRTGFNLLLPLINFLSSFLRLRLKTHFKYEEYSAS